MRAKLGIVYCCFLVLGCTPFSAQPVPGPDKQASGILFGTGAGAGAGIVTAVQLGVATGPGAWIGAGMGGLFGMFSGLGVDMVEEDQITQMEETKRLEEKNWAQARLAEHYMKRLDLHPNRDIFPADWFFLPDSAEFHPGGEILVQMLAEMTQQRMPWSRIVITAYNTSNDPKSAYAAYITRKRAEAIAFNLIHCGLEPRRILTDAKVTNQPLVVDPNDNSGRYRQAIELVPLDY